MFCGHCGKPIDEGKTFCANCGNKVEPEEPQTHAGAPSGHDNERQPASQSSVKSGKKAGINKQNIAIFALLIVIASGGFFLWRTMNGQKSSDEQASTRIYAVEQKGKWGFYNAKGTMIAPCIYDNLSYHDFSEGLAAVSVPDGTRNELGEKNYKYGFIDKTGKVVIPFIYYWVDSFNNDGLAAVAKGSQYDVIDKT